MDFIERVFHIAPDGGSGSLELAIVLGLMILPIAFALFRKRPKTAPREPRT
jgi:hypothetical protein